MTRINRAVAKAAVVAVIVFFLMACTARAPLPEQTSQSIPHDAGTGQTLAEAREAIDAVPGISVTNFAGGGPPNVKGNTGYAVAFDVEPGYTLTHGDLLVDYIVRTVWAIGEGYMPNTQLQISARTADGEPFFDLSTAGVKSAWTGGRASTPSQHNTIVIPLSPDDPEGARNLALLKREGTWPGVIPKPIRDDATTKQG